MTELNNFKNSMETYIKTGYPHIIIFANRALGRRYKALGQALITFRPKGVDEHYKKTFVKEMKTFGGQLMAESKKIMDQTDQNYHKK